MSNSPGRNLKERMSPSASSGLDRDTMSQQNAASPESMSGKATILTSDALTSDSLTADPLTAHSKSGDSKGGATPKLMQGTVKWFNDAKGFGFIEHDSGRDVFVHYSVIETEGFKTLKDGEIVFYSLAEGDKGLHAGRVLRDPSVVKTAKAKSATEGTETTETTLSGQMEVEKSNSTQSSSERRASEQSGSEQNSSDISPSSIKASQSSKESANRSQSDQE